jgi:hypothetical protein
MGWTHLLGRRRALQPGGDVQDTGDEPSLAGTGHDGSRSPWTIVHATPDVRARAVPATWTECLLSDWTCGSDQDLGTRNDPPLPSSSLRGHPRVSHHLACVLTHKGSPLEPALDEACRAAGVPHISIHGLRRTFNNLLRRVAEGIVTRAMLGHTNEAMTEHYSHVDLAEKHSAAAAVSAAVKGVPAGAAIPAGTGKS